MSKRNYRRKMNALKKAGAEGLEPPRHVSMTPGKQPGASANSATPQQ